MSKPDSYSEERIAKIGASVPKKLPKLPKIRQILLLFLLESFVIPLMLSSYRLQKIRFRIFTTY